MSSESSPQKTESVLAKISIGIAIIQITASFGYVWNANAEFAVLKRDVNQLQNSNLDMRITTVESNIRNNTALLNKVNDKIDRLLEDRRK